MLLQHSNPAAQPEVVRPTDKKMQMIRHDDVATGGDRTFRVRSDCELHEGIIYRIPRQQFLPPIRAECDEIERVIRKDPSQTRWEPRIIEHAIPVAFYIAGPLASKAVAVERISCRLGRHVSLCSI